MCDPNFSSQDAAAVFNGIMSTHGLNCRASAVDFIVSSQCATLGFTPTGEALAKLLFDEVFPPSVNGIYHHYTSYGGFKGIASSGCLRLYNLHKRFGSGEFRTFCRDHGMDGYLREGDSGQEEGHFATLMDDLFYTSLVNEDAADSDLHWEKFANDHQGVRLTFEVNCAACYPNFRAVTYQSPDCLPVLRDLRSAFLERGRHFVNLGLSRMGGFYQREGYSSQYEHRLLAKRFPDGPPGGFPFEVHDEGERRIKYIESSLTQCGHPWFNVKLLSVLVGKSGSLPNVQNYLEHHSRFADLKATQAT
jgi:hypothetical protein